jgi:hypothetical protein
MKQRPRRAEREIARILSEKFVGIGMDPVERIPVLGRTGPDISLNQFRLVVDVKSRLEVPKGYLVPEITSFGALIGVPLCKMQDLAFQVPETERPVSVIVNRWFAHMDEWTKAKTRGGITALVLHRPKLPFGKAVLIISKSQMEEFARIWQQQIAMQSNVSNLPRIPLSLPL